MVNTTVFVVFYFLLLFLIHPFHLSSLVGQPTHITMMTSTSVSMSQGANALPAVNPAAKRTTGEPVDDMESYERQETADKHWIMNQ